MNMIDLILKAINNIVFIHVQKFVNPFQISINMHMFYVLQAFNNERFRLRIAVETLFIKRNRLKRVKLP